MWYSLFSSIFVILPHVSLLSVQLLTERLTGQATSIIKEQSEHAMQLTQQFKLITNREIQDEVYIIQQQFYAV